MKYTVKKIYTGETYKETNGKEYILMGSTGWAVVNENNEVVDFYSAKYIAQEVANEMNV